MERKQTNHRRMTCQGEGMAKERGKKEKERKVKRKKKSNDQTLFDKKRSSKTADILKPAGGALWSTKKR